MTELAEKVATGSMGVAPALINRVERRSKQRVYDNFPVKVRGRDSNGERFKAETVLDNLSVEGLYLRLKCKVTLDTRLFFIIRLSVGSEERLSAPVIAVGGRVKRIEPCADGSYGVAVSLTSFKFL
jgi:PilZ domain